MSLILSLKKEARKWLSSLQKSSRRFNRIFIPSPKDPKKIPIIINNFNRLSYPQLLIARLEEWGYNNIIILDNNSTYPPLLEFYKNTKHEVIRLSENKGYMALWNSEVFKRFKGSYYVYTDPDVLPLPSCGEQFLGDMLTCLNKYPEIEKLGLALCIHDLPDHYAFKQQVIDLEKVYWQKEVAEGVYDAPVDTTFALYKPLAHGNADQCKAHRLNGKYGAQHLPWYEDSSQPSEEERYYRAHVSKNSSYWMNLKKE
jgi:hypothetical protein